MHDSKKKTSFTKKLLVLFIGMAIWLTLTCVYTAIFKGTASTELVTLTASWIGATDVFAAFYVWKAKNENRSKYAQIWVNAIAEQYGIENAARFAEIVLKE